MILILSNKNDLTTIHVQDWIKHYKIDHFRINQEDKIKINSIHVNGKKTEFELLINNFQLKLSSVSAYWYRRGWFNVEVPEKNNNEVIDLFVKNEINISIQTLHFLLKDKFHIGSFLENQINKLNVLNEARKIGMDIPATLITTDKEQLKSFLYAHKTLITKAIFTGLQIKFTNEFYAFYTTKIESKDLKKIPDRFQVSLFQEYLDKVVDLRIFYLNGQFKTAAIYSQNDDQTKVDFRKYNYMKPNRNVPFELPENQKKMIDILMKVLGYKSGSIDMVLTTTGRYTFLEINPIGQFGQISLPCNFHLEHEVAKLLISKSIKPEISHYV